MRRLWIVLDIVLLLILLVSLAIIVTGGGIHELDGKEIRARNSWRLLDIAMALCVLRIFWGASQPILGIRRLSYEGIDSRCRAILDGMRKASSDPRSVRWRRVLWLILLASLAFKLGNIVVYDGFFSGDDVEIHLDSISRVREIENETWSLRNMFYPWTFIAPAQHLMLRLGASTWWTIATGRIVVALWSLVALLLVFAITRQLTRGSPWSLAVALAAAALLVLNPAETGFASTALPRPVASGFLLAGAFLLLRPGAGRASLAAMLIGLAVAMRFSEMLVLPAAFTVLLLERRPRAAFLVPVLAAATALSVLAVFDLLFGRGPFDSLQAVWNYTIVERHSSRGFQPWHLYLTTAHRWLTLPGLVLFLLGLRRTPRGILVWLGVPLLLLSFLPHKEHRYLVPYMGFAAIVMAHGLLRSIEYLEHSGRKSARLGVALSALLLFTVLTGLDGQRFRRSDGAVRLAREIETITATREIPSVAFQQRWKAGSTIYMWRVGRVADLDPSRLRAGDRAYLRERLLELSPEFLGLDRDAARNPRNLEVLEALGYESREGPWEHANDPHWLFVRSSQD